MLHFICRCLLRRTFQVVLHRTFYLCLVLGHSKSQILNRENVAFTASKEKQIHAFLYIFYLHISEVINDIQNQLMFFFLIVSCGLHHKREMMNTKSSSLNFDRDGAREKDFVIVVVLVTRWDWIGLDWSTILSLS